MAAQRKVHNEEDAVRAIEAVAVWLSNYREPLRKGDCGKRAPVENETRAAFLARNFSDDLLEASDADGLCGCKLCQG